MTLLRLRTPFLLVAVGVMAVLAAGFPGAAELLFGVVAVLFWDVVLFFGVAVALSGVVVLFLVAGGVALSGTDGVLSGCGAG